MLRTQVKASAVANLTDARYFAAWGVQWLGFPLDPAFAGHLKPQQMLAISGWVDGVQIVGEFEMQREEEIREAVELLALDAVQLGPLAPLSLARNLGPDLTIIKELAVDQTDSVESLLKTMEEHQPYCAFFLLSLDKGGFSWQDLAAGRPFPLETLQQLARDFPIWLGLDFDEVGLGQCLEQLNVRGIGLQGGVEEKVGYKSFDQLDELFELIELAEG